MKTAFLSSLLALLAVGGEAANSAGCGKAAGVQSGKYTVAINNKQRQYIVRVPNNYNQNKPYRLIFTLHWLGGSMNDAVSLNGGYYGLQSLAQESAIFVAPDGLNQGWGNQGGEDLEFIKTLVQKMDDSLCVDQDLRFSTGFSYGAGMSYEIACALPDKFRAVALLSGAQLSGCDGGTKPIAFMSAHGTHDNVLQLTNGKGLRDHFLTVNGCKSKDAPDPSNGSGTHIKTEYDCKPGYPVWWYSHDGDHTPSPSDRGQPTWAPAETWKFFSLFNTTTTPAPTTKKPTPTTPKPTKTKKTKKPKTKKPTTPPPTTTPVPTTTPTPATTPTPTKTKKTKKPKTKKPTTAPTL